MSVTDSKTTAKNVEHRLDDILKDHLDPPLDILADRMWHFLSSSPCEPSVERALAAYFELFANGYTIWGQSYDYHKIHEYFYCGYLQAIPEGGETLSPQLKSMLEEFTRAWIDYTWCENALICNDPQGLFTAASNAVMHAKQAQQLLRDSSLRSSLRAPIEKYLEMNLSVLCGLKHCAEIFLAALRNKEVPVAIHDDVNQLLSSVEAASSDVASFLRAHYMFTQHSAQAHLQRTSDLIVKEGKLLLRANGYIGEELVTALFKVASRYTSKKMCELACTETRLPIVSVRSAYMQDIFETILGKEYLEQIIFELRTDGSALTVPVYDGEKKIRYPIEKFEICVARFGTITVEFSISVNNVSVSHVRVLESLIGPHTGRFDFDWRDAPQEIGRGTTNFVDFYLNYQDFYLKCWERVKSIQQEMPEVECDTVKKLQDVLARMKGVLVQWERALGELATWLPRPFIESSSAYSKQDEQLKKIYEDLQQHFESMRDLAQEWCEQASNPNYSVSEIVIPSRGVRFGRLMDIAEEVLRRMKDFLRSDLSKIDHEVLKTVQTNHKSKQSGSNSDETLMDLSDSVGRLFTFDGNTGWAAILSCTKLAVVERDRRTSEPCIEWGYQKFSSHPEFKGLIIQSREARAGLDDWLFVAIPPYRNLATIRSHETDLMCIGENRAFLYLPNEPQWVVMQYIETARLIDDIRTLVFSFNRITRDRVKELKENFGGLRQDAQDMNPKKRLGEVRNELLSIGAWLRHPERGKKSEKGLSGTRKKLLSKRNEIEDLRGQAERILDLLRSCTISKYQDHSDLLKEMIKEIRLNDARDALEHNIEHLDRFHAYLTDSLKLKVDKRIQSYQQLLTWLVAFLTLVSTLSAIPTLYPFLTETMGGIMPKNTLLLIMEVLLVGILLGAVVAFLIAWFQSRDT